MLDGNAILWIVSTVLLVVAFGGWLYNRRKHKH